MSEELGKYILLVWIQALSSSRLLLPCLLLGRLTFVLDGVSINGRFEAERPPTLSGPPSSGRAVFMTPMQPLYITRPHSLVQAIFWHTCQDLDLDP